WTLAVVLLSLTGGVASPAHSTDWSDCQDELERLKRGASEAADAAEHAEQAARELESKRDDVESAASLLRLCSSSCSFQRYQFQSARDDYESAKSDYDYAARQARSEVA